MQRHEIVVQDPQGNVIRSAVVQINLYGTSTAATLFADPDGVTPLDNPLSANSLGSTYFYAANGRYNALIYVNSTLVETRMDILLNDPGDPVNADSITVVTLNVTGNTTMGGTLAVTGNTTLTTLSTSGNTTVGGTLGVIGAATFAALTATGQVSLGGAAGAEGLRVTTTASAVNRVDVSGAATGGRPLIISQGEANIGLRFGTASGTGAFSFLTNNAASEQFRIAHTASAVNYPQVSGAATGNGVTASAQGSDSAVNFFIGAKGAGAVVLQNNSATQLSVFGPASAVNNWQAGGATAGNRPSFTVQGSDTNPGGSIFSKGTGDILIGTNGASTQLQVSHTASAVNWVGVTGSATGNSVVVSGQGSDSNVAMISQPKGAGSFFVVASGGTQFEITNTASAVNRVTGTGGATGVAPSISVAGSDANINLALYTKGTGVVKFGTHTASADAPISGYITIQDSSGNLRKLAVIT